MKNTLFDLGPAPDVPRSRRKAVRPAYEQAAAPEPSLKAPAACLSAEILGRCDDGFICGDLSCGGTAGDVVAEDSGQWYVACCFCGTATWMTAPMQITGDAEFKFRGGQHHGKTLAEVQATGGGRRYLAWAAEKHPRQFVREAVKKWLTSQGAGG